MTRPGQPGRYTALLYLLTHTPDYKLIKINIS